MHLIVLLGDVDQAEARFDPFGDSFNIGARKVHSLRRMYHKHGNRFGHNRWYSYVMYVKWKLVLVHLVVVLASAQDRCTVSVECTIGLKIILDAPDGTPS
jgi:cytochrome b